MIGKAEASVFAFYDNPNRFSPTFRHGSRSKFITVMAPGAHANDRYLEEGKVDRVLTLGQ